MWQFMQTVNEKRGLKLEVCGFLLLLWRERWVPNEPIDHVVLHAETPGHRHSASFTNGALDPSALISGKTSGKAVD
jgi:hypothetical protein